MLGLRAIRLLSAEVKCLSNTFSVSQIHYLHKFYITLSTRCLISCEQISKQTSVLHKSLGFTGATYSFLFSVIHQPLQMTDSVFLS